MPLFDLGNDLKVTQNINADLERAYGLSKQILDSYKQRGYQVRWEREVPHTELVASFSDRDNTKIKAQVKLAKQGSTSSRLDIHLTGKVFVGGLKGAMANDGMVQKAAKDMLIDEIKKALKGNGLAAALEAIFRREQIYAYHQQQQASRLA